MDELNGRMMAGQTPDHGTDRARRRHLSDPLRFLTEFRDEIKAG